MKSGRKPKIISKTTTGYLPHHLADFEKSGLSLETIKKAGYESVEEKYIDELDDLGRKRKRKICSHWRVPICSPYTTHTEKNVPYYYRKKLDEPIVENKGKKNQKEIFYVSPSKSVPRLYFSRQVDNWKEILESNQPIFLTEGEKKADKLIQEGYIAVAISGVWCWSKDKNPIDDMDYICSNKRKIFITFDSDYRYKESVQSALTQLKLCIVEKGCTPIDCCIPEGKEKGVDDYIIKHGKARWDEYVKEVTEQNKHRETYEQKVEEAAWAYLKNPNMLDELITDIRKLGIIGEEANLIRLYFACISHKQESCIGVILKGASASGKTTLVRTITSLMPDGVVEYVTSQSAQALNYWLDVSHKIVVITEEKPPEDEFWEVASGWRQLVEDGEIIRIIVDPNEKDIEKRRKKLIVKGPIVYLSTTTQSKLHEENENRLLIFNTDDSVEHIESIVQKVLEGDEDEVDEEIQFIIAKHKKAIQLLKPIRYKKIRIPFRGAIRFNAFSPEATRDSKKLIKLIRLLAYLHQYQRGLEATSTTLKNSTGDNKSLGIQEDTPQNSIVATTPLNLGVCEEVCISATIDDYNSVLKYFKDYFDANSSDIPKDLTDKWNKIYKFTGDNETFTYDHCMRKWGLKNSRVKVIVKDMIARNMVIQVEKTDELFNKTQGRKNQFRCIAYNVTGSGLIEIKDQGVNTQAVNLREADKDTHTSTPTQNKSNSGDDKNLQANSSQNNEPSVVATSSEKSDVHQDASNNSDTHEGTITEIEDKPIDGLAMLKGFLEKGE